MNAPWPKVKPPNEKPSHLKPPPRAAGAVTVDSVGTLVLNVLESIDLVDADSVTNGNPTRSSRQRSKFGFSTSSSTSSSNQPTATHAVSIAVILVSGLDDASDREKFLCDVDSGSKVIRTATKLVHLGDKVIMWGETFNLPQVSGSMKLLVYATDYFPGSNGMKVVGRAIVPLSRFPVSESIEQWYQLHPLVSSGNSITKAAIRLRLKFEPMVEPMLQKQKWTDSNDDSARDVLPPNPHRFPSHMNRWKSSITAGLDTVATPSPSNFSMSAFNFSNTASMLLGQEVCSSFAMKPLRAGIVDYFLICGPATDDDGNVQLASVSGDVYCNTTVSGMENFQSTTSKITGTGIGVIHHLAMALEGVELESALLECVPTEPRDNVPYLMKDDWFCFPNGLYLVASDDRPPPSLSSFVKCCNGVKSYGLSLTMYFPASINVDALLALQQENEEGGDRAASHNDNGLHQWLRSPAGCNGVFPLWVPVCVCLVCHIPVIHALMDWLRGFQSYLESIEIGREKISSCSTRGTSMVDNHHLQAAIFQLVMEVPLPIPGVCAISVEAFPHNKSLANSSMGTYRFSLPDVRDIPHCGYGLSTLARCLGPDAVVTLFSASVQECRILLHSSILALLPYIAEGIFTLMYPLQWPYAYVPVLPKMLLEHVESPQPFVLGVHSRWIKHLPSDIFHELVVVNCDTGTVHAPDISPFPRTIRRRLIKAVREVTLLDFDFKEPWKNDFSTPLYKRNVPSCSKEAVEASEMHMQYAFVKAMADLLYGFTDCLFFVEQNRPVFNSTRFLSEYAEEEHVPFISCMIDTLAFKFFMENHDAPHLYPFMKLMSSARKEAFLRGEFTHRGHPITHEEGDWNNNNSPLHMSNDGSIPTMVVSNSLLDQKMFMLDAYPIEDVQFDAIDHNLVAEDETKMGYPFSGGGNNLKNSSYRIKGSSERRSSRKQNDVRHVPEPPRGEEEQETEQQQHQQRSSLSSMTNEDNSGQPSQAVESLCQPEVPEMSTSEFESIEKAASSTEVANAASELEKCEIDERHSSNATGSELHSKVFLRTASFSTVSSSSTRSGSSSIIIPPPAAPSEMTVRTIMRLRSSSSHSRYGNGESISLFMGSIGCRNRCWSFNDMTISDGLLSMDFAATEAQQIVKLVQWKLDPILHLQTELWPIPQSFKLSHMEEAIGKNLREELQSLIHSNHTEPGGSLVHNIGEHAAASPLKPSLGVNTGEEGKQLQECLEAMFSGQYIPEAVLHGAEESIRKYPEVRYQFLEVLQQPGRGGLGHNGPFLLHELGFEALARFSYTLLHHCIDVKEYDTAHMLLLFTGAYFQVHDSVGVSMVKDSDSVISGETTVPEFLSSRLCRHSIFRDTEFWLHIAQQRVESGARKPRGRKRTYSRFSFANLNCDKVIHEGTKSELVDKDEHQGLVRRRSFSHSSSILSEPFQQDSAESKEPEGDTTSLINTSPRSRSASVDQHPRHDPAVQVVKNTLYEMVGIGVPESMCKNFITSAAKNNGLSQSGLMFLQEKANTIWRSSRAEHKFMSVSSSTRIDEGAANGDVGEEELNISMLQADACNQKDAALPGTVPQPLLLHKSFQIYTRSQNISFMGSKPSFRDCMDLIKGGTGQAHVTCLASVGQLALAGRSDSSVAVCDINRENLLTLMTGHTDAITSIACCAGWAVTSSLDQTLRVWRLPDVEENSTFHLTQKSSEGRKLHFPWLQPTVARKSMESTHVLSGHKGPVRTLEVLETEETKRFTSGTGEGPKDQCISYGPLNLPFVGHKGHFHVLSGSSDGDVRMWSPINGVCDVVFSGHSGPITSLSSLWSAKLFLSGSEDHTMRLWDANSDTGYKSLRKYVGHSAAVTVVGFVNSSVSISGSADGKANMWDRRSKTGIVSFEGHSGPITSLCFMKEVVCTASADSSIRVWDLRATTKDPLRELHHVDRVNGLLPLEKSFLSCSEDSVVIEWDSGEFLDDQVHLDSRLGVYTEHEGGVSCMCYSGDGFISGSWDGGLKMWPNNMSKG